MCSSRCGSLRTVRIACATCGSCPPVNGSQPSRLINDNGRACEPQSNMLLSIVSIIGRASLPWASMDRSHTVADFHRLPVLTKRDIRQNGDALLSSEFRREDLVEARTGGSTGTALTLYFDEACQEVRGHAAAMRSDGWAGWDIGMKVAAVWGNPPVADTLKKRLRNRLLDRIIYLDTMSIDDASVRRFVHEWRREQPRMIFGHSHSIYLLALFLRRFGIDDLRPRGSSRHP